MATKILQKPKPKAWAFAFCASSRQYFAMISMQRLGFLLAVGLLPFFTGGCAVVAVADAAVTVVATTVKVGATVVGTTVDVAATGAKAVAGDSEEEK